MNKPSKDSATSHIDISSAPCKKTLSSDAEDVTKSEVESVYNPAEHKFTLHLPVMGDARKGS